MGAMMYYIEPYIAILNTHGVGYCCIINGTSKREAMGLFKKC